MDDFEKELRQALERRPAPPSLKRRIMERRGLLTIERRRFTWMVWQRVAAVLVLAVVLGGTLEWRFRRVQERRQGEEARRQLMIALRITGHALNEMNAQLNRNHDGDD
jgi:uncharacterized membrane protein